MKINWLYPVILIIVSILLIALGLFYSNMRLRKNNQRMTDNIEQILLERDSKVLEITKKEFDKYYAQKDSLLIKLMDSLKIKTRHIERTINHKYTHTFDTTITMVREGGPGLEEDTVRTFRLEKDCIILLASINWKANEAKLDTVSIDYNATTAYYWKRKHKFWFIKWGRKQHYAVTKNNCTGVTKVIDIKFEK